VRRPDFDLSFGGSASHGDDPQGRINQSIQEAGGARELERGTDRVQVNELGIGREVEKFDCLRQLQQQRRRCEQQVAGNDMTAQIAQASPAAGRYRASTAVVSAQLSSAAVGAVSPAA